jgi:hypothetical protein
MQAVADISTGPGRRGLMSITYEPGFGVKMSFNNMVLINI